MGKPTGHTNINFRWTTGCSENYQKLGDYAQCQMLTLHHHRGHPRDCPRTRTPAAQENHPPACIPPRLCPAMRTLVHFFVQERFQRLFSTEKIPLGFPGGSVVKNPPANAGDTGSIPDPRGPHILWSNSASIQGSCLPSLNSRT